MFGAEYPHHRSKGWSAYPGWVVTPIPPDVVVATPVSGAPVFPDRAQAKARAAYSVYSVVASAQPAIQAVVTTASPVYPERTRAGTRAAFSAYSVVVSAQPAILAVAVTAYPSYPTRAPAAARSANSNYVVVTSARPALAPGFPPATFPVFPDRAPGPRRSSVSSYQGQGVFATPVIATDLGRYRLGDSVTLAWQGQVGLTVPPTAVFTGPFGVVASPRLSTRGKHIFTLTEFLSEAFALGNYTVNVSGDLYVFTVVAGGDPAGGVIAMNHTKNVQGQRVIVQTQRGELLLGTDPKLG